MIILNRREKTIVALLVMFGLAAVITFIGCLKVQPSDHEVWHTLDYGNFGVLRVHRPTGTCVLFHGNAVIMPAAVCESYNKER